jgi:hypothetical protein
VSEPFVYSIPLAIEQNESFPLGFSIAPTESIEFDSVFLQFMIRLGANREDIFNKPLLSDRGATLISYGREFRTHFHRVWRLLENYGGNKWFTALVPRMAFATCV